MLQLGKLKESNTPWAGNKISDFCNKSYLTLIGTYGFSMRR